MLDSAVTAESTSEIIARKVEYSTFVHDCVVANFSNGQFQLRNLIGWVGYDFVSYAYGVQQSLFVRRVFGHFTDSSFLW